MKMIVGLGNPGRSYDRTPHNVGFEVVDQIGRVHGVKSKRNWRFPLESAEIDEGGRKVLLVKPHTFMNKSGDAVGPLLRKKGIATNDLLVVVDDVELPLGAIRVRGRGSAGSHNGLKSVIERLGTQEFARLRIGLGPVPVGQDRVTYVLAKYGPLASPQIDAVLQRASDAARMWVTDGLERTMNEYNG